MTSVQEICLLVLKSITPSRKERSRIQALAKKLKEKVKAAAGEEGIEVEVSLEGSVAKDTWLSNEPEIDIFMRVPTSMTRKAFGTICLRAAKKATIGFKQIERFAEHPYLECVTENVRVNIVPCFAVEQGGWISAVDRTPYHTSYIEAHLEQNGKNEVRLLKQFTKGIDAYGAEIKVGGFSGYLCELLILYYGTFIEALKSAAAWREDFIIDPAGHYGGVEGDLRKVFKDHFIVVDPVDKRRNVAAALRKEKLKEFIAAARAFLNNPDIKFFFPPDIEAFDEEKLFRVMRDRGSSIVFVKFGSGGLVPDVLWGQLYKARRVVRRTLKRFDFNVFREGVWSDGEDFNILIFEVENRFLPQIKRHLGPPVEKREACEKFLEKHLDAETSISGPRIEGDRWIVEIAREYTDVMELLTEKLRDGGRRVGVGKFLAQAIMESFQVLINEEIHNFYSLKDSFAKFLTKYLMGKPLWLI